MVLYLIGLGLGDKKDITYKGLEIVRKCKKIFLESYTAIFTELNIDELKEFYQTNEIIIADRNLVESQSDLILTNCDIDDHCLLVIGDPLAATTHNDLIKRAYDLNITVKIIHNASIMNAVASCGLSLYRFGQTISIPYFNNGEKAEKGENTIQTSWYDKLATNLSVGYHTLCLLDIKVKEQTQGKYS